MRHRRNWNVGDRRRQAEACQRSAVRTVPLFLSIVPTCFCSKRPVQKRGACHFHNRPIRKQVATAFVRFAGGQTLVTRHVPKSLFILTRSAPKKCFGALRIEYKDATLAATKLSKNKPQNKCPENTFRGSFCGTTSDGLKQARSFCRGSERSAGRSVRDFETASNHRAGAGATRSSFHDSPRE